MKWLDLEVWATTPGAGTHGREKDAPSPPPPPDYSGIAATNEAAAKMAKETADADLAFRKQVYEESKPRQEQMNALATQVAQQQLGIADTNQAHANEQWQNYQNTYQPTELASAVDAFGGQYMSQQDADRASAILSGEADLTPAQAERELYQLSRGAEDRAAGQATTRAEAQSNSSLAQAMRAVQRMGGDPSRVASAAADLSSRSALGRVTASNAARESVRGQALGLRTGVANFGRNMPNTAGQAFGLATQAGSNATANQNAAFTSGLPYAQFQAGGYGSQMAAAGLKQQGALGMGNIMASTYGSQVGGYGAMANAQTAANGQTMEMIGTAAGVAAMFF